MSETIKVNGMIISSMPIGEYDRRVEILTDEMGRISAFARGARKPHSQLLACSQTFAFGKFELYQGKSAYSLNSANIRDYFHELADDLTSNCYGSYFLEVVRYFTQENLEALSTLGLLYYSLKAVADKKFDNELVRAIFELKILDINGIYREPEEHEIGKSARYTMDFVVNAEVGKLYTFKLSDEVQKEFVKTVHRLFSKTVDKKFKSLELLDVRAFLES